MQVHGSADADKWTNFASLNVGFFQGNATSRAPVPVWGVEVRHEEQGYYVENQASYLACWKLKFMLTSWVIQGHINQWKGFLPQGPGL